MAGAVFEGGNHDQNQDQDPTLRMTDPYSAVEDDEVVAKLFADLERSHAHRHATDTPPRRAESLYEELLRFHGGDAAVSTLQEHHSLRSTRSMGYRDAGRRESATNLPKNEWNPPTNAPMSAYRCSHSASTPNLPRLEVDQGPGFYGYERERTVTPHSVASTPGRSMERREPIPRGSFTRQRQTSMTSHEDEALARRLQEEEMDESQHVRSMNSSIHSTKSDELLARFLQELEVNETHSQQPSPPPRSSPRSSPRYKSPLDDAMMTETTFSHTTAHSIHRSVSSSSSVASNEVANANQRLLVTPIRRSVVSSRDGHLPSPCGASFDPSRTPSPALAMNHGRRHRVPTTVNVTNDFDFFYDDASAYDHSREKTPSSLGLTPRRLEPEFDDAVLEHGHRATLRAMQRQQTVLVDCFSCQEPLFAPMRSKYVYCPLCKSVSPTNISTGNATLY